MTSRKCGNIYFPKYFMAVRPFSTRKCYQELFGLEGSKQFLEKFRQSAQSEDLGPSLTIQEFFQKNIPGLYAAYVYTFWVVSL